MSNLRIAATFALLVAGGCNEPKPVDSGEADRQLWEQLQPLMAPEDAAAVLDLRTGKLLTTVNGDRLGRPARPGSTMKLVAAATLLRNGEAEGSHRCEGTEVIAGRAVKCWEAEGHGEVRLHRAIAQSCNLFFYDLATRLSADDFLGQARRFGFGGPTGWSPGEQRGVVPTALSTAELMDAVVGQTDAFQVTGFQLLRMAAVLSGVGDWRGASHGTDEIIRQAMVEAAESGTISPATINIPFAGKTGTTRWVGSWRVNGWFIGYAPANRPRYAFVVYVREGVGKDAANIAQTVIEKTVERSRSFSWRE